MVDVRRAGLGGRVRRGDGGHWGETTADIRADTEADIGADIEADIGAE
jgi:hypothetical protein